MKLPLWSSSRSSSSSSGDNKCACVQATNTSYAAEFRNFVQKNAPADFDAKFERARPYIYASFIAWPSFWLYKGLQWQRKRNTDRLISYINRAFFQAKFLQIAIIATGLLVANYGQSRQRDYDVVYNVEEQHNMGLNSLERVMEKIRVDD